MVTRVAQSGVPVERGPSRRVADQVKQPVPSRICHDEEAPRVAMSVFVVDPVTNLWLVNR
jgi:hypothetical protein